MYAAVLSALSPPAPWVAATSDRTRFWVAHPGSPRPRHWRNCGPLSPPLAKSLYCSTAAHKRKGFSISREAMSMPPSLPSWAGTSFLRGGPFLLVTIGMTVTHCHHRGQAPFAAVWPPVVGPGFVRLDPWRHPSAWSTFLLPALFFSCPRPDQPSPR